MTACLHKASLIAVLPSMWVSTFDFSKHFFGFVVPYLWLSSVYPWCHSDNEALRHNRGDANISYKILSFVYLVFVEAVLYLKKKIIMCTLVDNTVQVCSFRHCIIQVFMLCCSGCFQSMQYWYCLLHLWIHCSTFNVFRFSWPLRFQSRLRFVVTWWLYYFLTSNYNSIAFVAILTFWMFA